MIARLAVSAITLRRFPWLPRALAPIDVVTLETGAGADAVAGWGAKASAAYSRALARTRGLPFMTLEDGLYRSVGLGKAGAPSLSLTLDRSGVFFDARTVSDLEALLSAGVGDDVVSRGALLRAFVATRRLSKYNHLPEDSIRLDAPKGLRRIVLVDQVAGDRSLIGAGASAETFAAMRAEAAALAREGRAAVYLRTHPDVEAGYAKGMLGAPDAFARAAPACGPHALLDEIDEVWTASSQFGLDALLRGVDVVTFAAPFYAGWGLTQERVDAAAPHARAAIVRRAATRLSLDAFAGAAIGLFPRYYDPARERPVSAEEGLDRLAFWRDRHFSRRGPVVAVGFARHKRDLARAHLGAAGANVTFIRHEPDDLLARAKALGAGEIVAWSDRLSHASEAKARAAGLAVTRVEDGFVRSRGLGRKTTPPSSLCFDARALHFDAARASDLETLLETHVFSDAERARGAALREKIVVAGLTKYNLAEAAPDLRTAAGGKRIALVMAQVPGDASWRHGAARFKTNLEFLAAARAAAADAFLVFKDHPDLVAGLRPGATPQHEARRLADLVLTSGDAAALYPQIDELHVMTSLSGFEALLRGRTVTCWGLPFYAGWGLTRDMAACARRTRRLALDELVVAALGLYPAWLDPESGVPARPEDILERLATP
jgi:capsular polysaccharide export protein